MNINPEKRLIRGRNTGIVGLIKAKREEVFEESDTLLRSSLLSVATRMVTGRSINQLVKFFFTTLLIKTR